MEGDTQTTGSDTSKGGGADGVKSVLEGGGTDGDKKSADASGADKNADGSDKSKNGGADGVKSVLEGGGADGDKKSADASGADKKAGEADGDKTAGPVDWGKTIKVPDGAALDEPLLKAIGPVFDEMKLTAEQGQKLADTYTRLLAEREAEQKQEFESARSEMQKDLLAKVQREDIAYAKRAVVRCFDAETQQLIYQSGMGDHAGFVSALAKIGRLVSDDGMPGAGASGSGGEDAAGMLFDKSGK